MTPKDSAVDGTHYSDTSSESVKQKTLPQEFQTPNFSHIPQFKIDRVVELSLSIQERLRDVSNPAHPHEVSLSEGDWVCLLPCPFGKPRDFLIAELAANRKRFVKINSSEYSMQFRHQCASLFHLKLHCFIYRRYLVLI